MIQHQRFLCIVFCTNTSNTAYPDCSREYGETLCMHIDRNHQNRRRALHPHLSSSGDCDPEQHHLTRDTNAGGDSNEQMDKKRRGGERSRDGYEGGRGLSGGRMEHAGGDRERARGSDQVSEGEYEGYSRWDVFCIFGASLVVVPGILYPARAGAPHATPFQRTAVACVAQEVSQRSQPTTSHTCSLACERFWSSVACALVFAWPSSSRRRSKVFFPVVCLFHPNMKCSARCVSVRKPLSLFLPVYSWRPCLFLGRDDERPRDHGWREAEGGGAERPGGSGGAVEQLSCYVFTLFTPDISYSSLEAKTTRPEDQRRKGSSRPAGFLPIREPCSSGGMILTGWLGLKRKEILSMTDVERGRGMCSKIAAPFTSLFYHVDLTPPALGAHVTDVARDIGTRNRPPAPAFVWLV